MYIVQSNGKITFIDNRVIDILMVYACQMTNSRDIADFYTK